MRRLSTPPGHRRSGPRRAPGGLARSGSAAGPPAAPGAPVVRPTRASRGGRIVGRHGERPARPGAGPLHRAQHRRRRGRRTSAGWCSRSTARARSSPTTGWPSWSRRIRDLARPGRGVGRARRAPGPPRASPSSRPSPARSASPPAAASATWATRRSTRRGSRRRSRTPSTGSRTGPSTPTTALELGLAERPAPVLGEFLIDLDGVETKEVEDEEGRTSADRRRRVDPGVLQAAHRRPAAPHRGQPGGRLPAAAHRPGADRVRAVHRRRRRRRPGRRRVHRPRLLRPGQPARPGVGRRPCWC